MDSVTVVLAITLVWAFFVLVYQEGRINKLTDRIEKLERERRK